MEIDLKQIGNYKRYISLLECLENAYYTREEVYYHLKNCIGYLRVIRGCKKKRYITHNRPNVMFADTESILVKEIRDRVEYFKGTLKAINRYKEEIMKYNPHYGDKKIDSVSYLKGNKRIKEKYYLGAWESGKSLLEKERSDSNTYPNIEVNYDFYKRFRQLTYYKRGSEYVKLVRDEEVLEDCLELEVERLMGDFKKEVESYL